MDLQFSAKRGPSHIVLCFGNETKFIIIRFHGFATFYTKRGLVHISSVLLMQNEVYNHVFMSATFCVPSVKSVPYCSVFQTSYTVYILLTHQSIICLNFLLAVNYEREVPYVTIYIIIILFSIFFLKNEFFIELAKITFRSFYFKQLITKFYQNRS